MVSTFSMLNYGHRRRSKCHKTLSYNFFGVIQQFDSTTTYPPLGGPETREAFSRVSFENGVENGNPRYQ